MVRQRFGYGVTLWALLSSACAPSTRDKVTDAQEFPKVFAKDVCGAFARCCEHQSYELDVTQCERSMETDVARELADYDGLQVRFDASAAELCRADYANAACLERPSENHDIKRNCNVMFKGLVEPGGACQDSDECHVEGRQSAQCADGTCKLDSEPPKGAEAGAACGGTCKNGSAENLACKPGVAAFNDPVPDPTLAVCFTSDGLHCAGTAGARTCQPLVAEGGSCLGSSQGCAAGTFCDLETRTCRAQTDSAACGPETDACMASSACDLETGRCVPTGSPVGTRCNEHGDCGSGYCNPSSVCQQPFSAGACAQPRLN